jgi:lipoprotein-anchoring transpeptidase ErfK/SrfK
MHPAGGTHYVKCPFTIGALVRFADRLRPRRSLGAPLSFFPRARGVGVAGLAALLILTAGIVASSAPDCAQGRCQTLAAGTAPRPAPPPPPSPTEPASIYVTPAAGATDVSPADVVRVSATKGTLDSVTMVNDDGKQIAGSLTSDGTSWSPKTQLGYGRTYTVTLAGRGPGGMPTRQTSSFTTLNPTSQTQVYLNTVGYAPIQDGGTYGVGMVVVAHFDEPIADRAAAERHLHVATEPKALGSWHWTDDQTAHWRPQKYYAPGTKVSVAADLYGTKLGDGLYGQQDRKVGFTIGDSHVSIADDVTKQVSVYANGQLLRTMPTSMGMGGTKTFGDRTLSFWTPPGVYSVIGKANPVIMDSSTFGLPVDSSLGYRETIPWATQISGDGIYLHQLNATVWAQGNTDTSHGCLNLNSDNAQWFYGFSVPGDVVEVRNTGGPPLRLDQNGDWTLSWADWLKGSALLD